MASEVIGYLRASTKEQKYGPEAQKADIEQWAAANGKTITAWEEDNCCSTRAVERRKGLKKVFERLKALPRPAKGEQHIIVAGRRDRLARDVGLAVNIERMAKTLGAVVTTAKGGGDDTPEGILLRRILDAIAEYELALIRKRTEAAAKAKQRRGELTSGRVPFGFRAVPNTSGHYVDGRGRQRRLEPTTIIKDADEQHLLTRILDLRDRGMSPGAIAKTMNGLGLRFRGGPWHKTTIARILARQ